MLCNGCVPAGKFDGTLVTSSVSEQFERAVGFVDKYPDRFSERQLGALRVRGEMGGAGTWVKVEVHGAIAGGSAIGNWGC